MKWYSGVFPVQYGFCANEKEWKSIVRSSKNPSISYPSTHGCCNLIEFEGYKKIIVTIKIDKDSDPLDFMTTLVHESVHVFQFICEEVCEEYPSNELEAYYIEEIFTNLLHDVAGKPKKIPLAPSGERS